MAPLQVRDADEMAEVLGDVRLHEFIGARPATLEELRERYRRLVEGSTRPGETWLNWTLRTSDGRAVGTLQATIRAAGGAGSSATVAWVIGAEHQGRGLAGEAAAALVSWLRGLDVDVIEAHVHPGHVASAAVARRAGLVATDERVGGETVWRTGGRAASGPDA
jgi:RimJ/RimL family protein N-acetyltransferase